MQTVLFPCASADPLREMVTRPTSSTPSTLSTIPLVQLASLCADDIVAPYAPAALSAILALDEGRAAALLGMLSFSQLAEQAIAQAAWLDSYGLRSNPLEILSHWLSIVAHAPAVALDA